MEEVTARTGERLSLGYKPSVSGEGREIHGGDSRPRRCVEIALVARGRAPASLTYAVPDHLDSLVAPGTAVSVPLGSRRVPGVVLAEASGAAPPGLKAIDEVFPEASLPPDLIALLAWAADYYRVGQATLLWMVLPPAVRHTNRLHVRPAAPRAIEEAPTTLLPLPDRRGGSLTERILARLPDAGLDLAQLQREIGPGAAGAIRRLAAKGVLHIEHVAIERRGEALALLAAEGGEEALGKAKKQAEIYRFVRDRSPHPVSRAEIDLRFPGAGDAVRRLLTRGSLVPSESDPNAATQNAPPERALRPEQENAVRAIEAARQRFETFLLFGVTASGKTEVYLRAAAQVRASGQSALLLVPEIGLTPQLIEQASRRFRGEVAVLHSGLSENERARAWLDVASGRTGIVIGARSAVFAPLPRLGLIVVDEEHDPAYKQEESPRYHARDVAVMRGKLAGCPVVLASATPSLESFRAAQVGRYQVLELPNRATETALPSVELIDLRAPSARPRAERPSPEDRRAHQPISPPLEDAIVENYRAGEQTLLFLNRRGYTRFIQCEECGRVEECPHCSVSLTVHRGRGVAACHHCGFERTPGSRCPDCGAVLVGRSFGTEHVEAALTALLPAARVARLDRDTSTSPGFVQDSLAAWRAGELDVLVGTQMIAKGHDAPGVTLIGVILADASLHFPDFRAAERTFQLLTQVAGRAGRGSKPGRVLVQTRHPDHPSLVAATHHDFRGFAQEELRSRAELSYPPFGRLARILLEGEHRDTTEKAAESYATVLQSAVASLDPAARDTAQVLGPAPAPIERLRGRHRRQLLVKAADSRTMRRILAAAERPRDGESVRTIVDVDPSSML